MLDSIESFFVVVIPVIYIKKIITNILRERHQQEICTYVAEMFSAFLLSLLTFLFVEVPIIRLSANLIYGVIGLSVSDEFAALCMVMTLVLTFFRCCKWMIRVSIKCQVWDSKRKEIKNEGKKKVSEALKEEDIRDKIRQECEEREEKAFKEFEYSKLYFYVIVNVILLSLRFEDNTYEKIFANAFMGVTTLAALLRETNPNK